MQKKDERIFRALYKRRSLADRGVIVPYVVARKQDMLRTLLLAGLLAVALAAPTPAPIPAPAPAPTPSPLAQAALLSAAPLPAAPLPSPVISSIGSPLLYPNYPASISVGYAPAASYLYKSYVI